ncbi:MULTISPECIES: redoxin domain-containing protein [unclassified Pseudomonas]|uniref:redoxin domain-containing protein n=1 Tax=unclassified Pseudomonas TaxID=196821 RepID=UPI000A1FC2B8|nr:MULTISPECIES: redoxin domain-containing protein [unclassified Pseudomonas]
MNTSEFGDAEETKDDLVQEPLPAGTVAPDFLLYATPDQQLSLRELKGNPVILTFYPADWSSVCGDQLTLYNQLLPTFREYGATLLGISVDSAWCHQAFAKDRNFHFSLLANFEPKGAVARRYGAYDSHLGVCKRALFVIDKEGVITWSYISPMAINPGADGILDALDALANAPQSTPTKN